MGAWQDTSECKWLADFSLVEATAQWALCLALSARNAETLLACVLRFHRVFHEWASGRGLSFTYSVALQPQVVNVLEKLDVQQQCEFVLSSKVAQTLWNSLLPERLDAPATLPPVPREVLQTALCVWCQVRCLFALKCACESVCFVF
jgi:hypothetical protein